MPLFLSFLAGSVLFFSSRFFPFCSIILFGAAAAYLIRSKLGIWVFVIVCGFFYAWCRGPVANETMLPWDRKVQVSGSFLQKGGPLPAGHDIFIFKVDKAVDEETGEEIAGLEDEEIRLKADVPFDPDDEYELLVRTGHDRLRLNPGNTSRVYVYAQLLEVQGQADATGVFGDGFDRYRNALRDYNRGHFSRDSADFISAITIGDTHLDENLKNAFNITGLAHILSISGTHFGLFSVVIFTTFVFLINRLPLVYLQRLTLYMTPSQAAAVLCLPLMMLYLGISGGSIPAVRSFLMVGLFLAGLLINRKGAWLNTVLLAAFILLLWDPGVVLALSFQLSFIAVLFIGFALEKKGEKEGVEKRKNRIVEFIRNSLKLTLAATLGTAPLVAYHFHYTSLISPLTNLLVAPLIGFLVIPFALISSFAYLLTGYYIFAPLTGLTTDFSLWLVKMLARVPFADIRVPAFPPVLVLLFYAGCLLYFVSGRKRLLLVTFLPLAVYAVYIVPVFFSPKEFSVTFLDVGQGDSAVLELPDGKTIVVDTGPTGHETVQYLKYLGRRDIDALALTHGDLDHCGGLDRIVRHINVREVWDNGAVAYDEEFAIPRKTLERGDVINAGGYAITVLHPYDDFYTFGDNPSQEDNNRSLVLKVRGEKRSILFAADIEDEAEEDIANAGKWLKCDVLKVPHHGGRSSAHQGFLFEVSPSIAVISVGKDNSFGHPAQEMLEALSGKKILRTDQDGAVKVTEHAGELQVKTWHDAAFEIADRPGKELRNMSRLFSSW
jgi:competence protein ComEC